MEPVRFTLRLHPLILQKMKFIAEHNGRSVNREIEQILKWIVDDYENKCGKIQLAANEKIK
ncbi:MAG: Arc family DNA-binding protein [Acidaminococcaceae bacterium]